MRYLRLVFVVVLAGGCGQSVADKCSSVNDQVMQILADPQSCTTASDCVVFTGGCAEADQCGSTVNMANAAKLKPLDADWTVDACGQGIECSECPQPITPLACTNGVCTGG
ncbi:MAG TPA: hypothetical protein VHB97_13815 [Polyangia bacterium]|jgi:hypothetical protein|nr:hypothetical protein [Polyangia bacterium]